MGTALIVIAVMWILANIGKENHVRAVVSANEKIRLETGGFNLKRQKELEDFLWNYNEGIALVGVNYFNFYPKNMSESVAAAVRKMARREGWTYYDTEYELARKTLYCVDDEHKQSVMNYYMRLQERILKREAEEHEKFGD